MQLPELVVKKDAMIISNIGTLARSKTVNDKDKQEVVRDKSSKVVEVEWINPNFVPTQKLRRRSTVVADVRRSVAKSELSNTAVPELSIGFTNTSGPSESCASTKTTI